MRRSILGASLLILASFLDPILARATVFATVHGVVHDPQHRPVPNAEVALKAAGSEFILSAVTGANGEFQLTQVPIGFYQLEISAAGFADFTQPLTITSATNPVLHVPLSVATSSESVVVNAPDAATASQSITPTTLISRADIDETPGATRTLGMEMITNYVPGSYMSHDMLHIRGGHQTSWLIDGVSIPNTKIASNVGPQIDPKDIDEVETQRGSYQADVGDRTYGVFNVLPRNGFERDRDAELLFSAGNLYSGEAQLSLGDHTSRTAWYTSATGSRSNYGLETPVPGIYHDATNSQSAFGSMVRNQTTRDQFRLDAQFRNDFFQIPYDPNPNDWEQASNYYNSIGLRDAQRERDSFVIFNWVRTLSPKSTFEVAPFYHFNQADYNSPASDLPVATTWHQASNYAGAQADIDAGIGPNSFSAGLYSFVQHESDLFGLIINDQSFSGSSIPNTTATQNAGIVEFHFSDQFKAGRYLSLYGGMRVSSYHAGLNEFTAYPRVGVTLEIPHLHWVFRGYYGRYFQPAPVLTVSPALLNYANGQRGQNTFVPLPSERDEEHQFGFGRFHLAYSNQIAEQRGPIIGGFTCSLPGDPICNPPDFSYSPVDHDQRNTLNTGFNANLPFHTWFSTNVYYGSGFHNGLAGSGIGPYQDDYLPVHTTFDGSAGHAFRESWNLSAAVVNVTNHRILQDNSITIGGFHYNDPRMISAQLRYRFHF
jgi:hypothetical protein